MNSALGFLEVEEGLGWQRAQRGLLDGLEAGEDVLLGRAVDALIGNSLLPLAKMGVLGGDIGELMSFEGVLLHVVDVTFDLALVLWRVRARGNDGRLIVVSEGQDLGVKFRIVPVGLFDGRLQIIDPQSGRNSSEVAKGVFERSEKVVGALGEEGLGVAFPRVAEGDAQDVAHARFAILAPQGLGDAEVDLSFFAGGTFHAPDAFGRCGSQSSDVAFD